MNLIPFDFCEITVRAMLMNGEAWFVAKDVAEVLGYEKARNAIATHCKGAQKQGVPTEGGIQEMTIIPERDVYRLVMRSRLPEAERFEEWVVGEVLPAIRRTGGYQMQPPKELSDPVALRGLLLTYTEKVIALEAKVEEARPAVQFYDQFSRTDGLYGLQNAGRALGLPPNKFIQRLKEKHLFYQGGTLVPKVAYIHRGYFEVKSTIIDDKARYRTFVTPKGLQYLAKEFAAEAA